MGDITRGIALLKEYSCHIGENAVIPIRFLLEKMTISQTKVPIL